MAVRHGPVGQGQGIPASDCGGEVTVYVRAKIGFCSCITGVSDDEELDRISDYDLLGNSSRARAPGGDRGRPDEGPQPRLHGRRPATVEPRLRGRWGQGGGAAGNEGGRRLRQRLFHLL